MRVAANRLVQSKMEFGMLTDDDVLALYERTVDEVYRYASRLTGNDRAAAEELVQETYLALVRQVRSGTAVPVDIGWLIVTCRNRFLDDLRSRRRRAVRERDFAGRNGPRDTSGGRMVDALGHLPGDQRAAMVLRYVDDLSVPDVARALGRSVHATESLLARGRVGVRAQLNQESAS
jgi:RNA polymerase sigma-70 factor, ECF subfamily